MSYPNYLIHYNKNHSKANGQFVSGDGDGDGEVGDGRKSTKTKSVSSTKRKPKKSKKQLAKERYNAQFDDPFSLQNMQKYTRRAEIFCDEYRKSGFNSAVNKVQNYATIDNFLQGLARAY